MIRLYILIFLTFILSYIANAQISYGGEPLSFKQHSLKSASVFNTPNFDYQKLVQEDLQADRAKPYRYGKLHEVNLSPYNSGTWSTASNGDRIWQLEIQSAKAFSIGLIFDKFKLNEGAKMFIFSADHQQVIGSFTNENNNKSGWFSTIAVAGEKIIIEIDLSANKEYGEINISGIIHDYKNAFGLKTGFGASAACNVNINCPKGVNWQNEKRSVVMLSSGGSLCTGVLINNTAYNSKPYLLTAEHCISSSSGANSAVFMFNYESPNCTATGNPTYQSISSAKLIATGGDLDFTLLELSVAPPPSYKVYYAGWNRGTSPAQNTVTIHHPEGDIKKISKDYDAPIIGDVASVYVSGYIPFSHWNIIQWDLAATEPGSSGSPLFDENHRIVGDLTGGDSDCSYKFNDFYARFDMSWDHYTDVTKQLKKWLDPGNTNVQTLDGFDPNLITPGVDVGVIQVIAPEKTYCSGSKVIPNITIQNKGTIDLTSVLVNYKLDNGSIVYKMWNGNLATSEIATILFDSITIPVGNFNFKAFTSIPNGVTDNTNYNDTMVSSFVGQGLIDNIPIDGPKEICSQALNGIYSVNIPGKYLWKTNGGSIEGTDTIESVSVKWNDWGYRSLSLNITNLCNSFDAEPIEIDVLEQTLDLQIATGDNGSSVCWSIEDCTGNVLYHDCGLEPNAYYTQKICVRKGCYRFNLYSENLGVNGYSIHNVLNSHEIVKGLSVNGSITEEFTLNPSTNLADFNVYPNPAETELVIEGAFMELYNNSQFAIFKLDGSMVVPYNNLDERKVIDISTLPKGMYIIEITSDYGKISKKFVKP